MIPLTRLQTVCDYMNSTRCYLFLLVLQCSLTATAAGGVMTWDGAHKLDKIEVQVVYFVPNDRPPLPDWQARASYYCRRIEMFHEREYAGQSTLTAKLHPTPIISQLSTEQLREGPADSIFFRTLRETDERLQFAQTQSDTFPILLVLSEINWRPLDDFFRVHPDGDGYEFEGNYSKNQHFPGARSGGARATYLSKERKGWGLVSGDGWRVPYRGSDCVVYHEGVGHTVGLPHPEPGNGSVMSFGQYQGWLSESWLDKEQKLHMQWVPPNDDNLTPQLKLYTEFRALPAPLVPQPDQEVSLAIDWPADSKVADCVVRYQTAVRGPWITVNTPAWTEQNPPQSISIGTFDRPTPVSYRINATLTNGSAIELWGYFQVRETADTLPLPPTPSQDLFATQGSESVPLPKEEIDILQAINTDEAWKNGEWTRDESGHLISPKKYGARIELPGDVPRNYRMTIIAEPLDPPNALLIGSRMDTSRFATLLNFRSGESEQSALENINGKNVGNLTTVRRSLFRQNQLSQIVINVVDNRVQVLVNGSQIINWTGKPEALSLGDYWSTPNPKALFLGTYDCSYRFYRVTLTELE